MTFPRARCPFTQCKATVELIVEQERPGDDESIVQRVKAHHLQPDSWYGYCPASLTLYPTSVPDLKAFAADIFRLASMRKDIDRQTREASARPPMGDVNGPRRAPAPDTWFRSHTGDNPRGERGPRGFARMLLGQLPLTEQNKSKGGAVASVGEVKAAIEQGCAALAEGMQMLQAAEGKIAEGEALLRWVGSNVTETLGAPQAALAIEQCTDAGRNLHSAIEEARAYGEQL